MKRNYVIIKSCYSTTRYSLNLKSDVIRIDDRVNDIKYNQKRAKILLKWLNNSINNNIKAYKKNNKNDLIYYENDHFLVINKPFDLLIDRNINDIKRPLSLENLIVAIRPEFKLPLKFCHQIDYQTSGVLLIAKSKQYASIACQAFYDKTVNKSYIALVIGHTLQVPGTDFIIDTPIGQSNDFFRMTTINTNKLLSKSFKQARTSIKILSWEVHNNINVTRLQLIPITGRRHQLRVHCAEILVHPILGDYTYSNDNTDVKQNRMYLHAEHLSLPNNIKCNINVTIPPEF